MITIQDGTGTGNLAKVSEDNRLVTSSVTISAAAEATVGGDSYNINTGVITLTSAGESGILYVKNNENFDMFISSIGILLGGNTGGDTTDTNLIKTYRNPTAGTLISGASAVSSNENRNFGDTSTWAADVFKGAEGNTVTDGDVITQSLSGSGSRNVLADIDFLLTPGASLAVTVEPMDSTTNMKVLSFIVVHRNQEI